MYTNFFKVCTNMYVYKLARFDAIDDVDDEGVDDKCVTCVRELPLPEETTIVDDVVEINDVTIFSWTFESLFEPTRRIISGVENNAGPRLSTIYAGDLRFSFFGCFFVPKNKLIFFYIFVISYIK